jgi:hypothetical protein
MARAPDIAALPSAEAVERKIAEVRKSRASAERDRGWTAVSTLHRIEADLLKRLAELRGESAAKPVDPTESMTEAELVDAITQAIDALPPSALDEVVARLDTRRAGRPTLKVHEGRAKR